jgi:hypothetical protein
MIRESKKEPLKVSLSMLLTSSRTLSQKTKRLWLNKLLDKSRKERKLKLPKSKETKRSLTKINKLLKKPKTKLPKKPKRRLLQRKQENDFAHI